MSFREVLRVLHLSTCCLIVAGFVVAEEVADYDSLAEALKNGDFDVTLLYRYEDVSDDGFTRDANASTLRSTVAYRSAAFHGFRSVLEFENVTDIGARDNHDNFGDGSLSNGVTGRPMIADPEITEVNQIYLSYHPSDRAQIAVGRQEFNIADQRFIGAVGWRQNHQAYEAVRLNLENLGRAKVNYAYMAGSNRINGGEWEQDSHILDVEIKTCEHGSVTPYYYYQDFDMQRGGLSASTRTVGVRGSGKQSAGAWKLDYYGEFAEQTDAADNPNQLDQNYYRARLGAKRKGLNLKLLYEVLGGDATDGKFETPQATLHAFNGWADRFLRTPDNGLIDLAVTVGYDWPEKRLKTFLTYHDFGADSSGPDHGSEIDGFVGWKSSWGQFFNAKFALYRADSMDTLVDVEKFWLWTGYSF